jgi:hypothetical protein
MIALKRKPTAAKCKHHRTVSPRIHTAKLVAKVLLKRKFKTCMEEISLDLEEEKEL